MKVSALILAMLFVLSAQAAPKSERKSGRAERHDQLVECGMFYLFMAERAQKNNNRVEYGINTKAGRLAMAYAVSLNQPDKRLTAVRQKFVADVKKESEAKSLEEVQNQLTTKYFVPCFNLLQEVSRR